MAMVSVAAEAPVGAPAGLVYDLITNFLEHHPRFLPNNFSDLEVEQGGVGAGDHVLADGQAERVVAGGEEGVATARGGEAHRERGLGDPLGDGRGEHGDGELELGQEVQAESPNGVGGGG